MKRWAIGLFASTRQHPTMIHLIKRAIVFSVALLIAGAVFVYWPAENRGTAEAQTVWTNSNAAPPRGPLIDDFVPELVDLPTFDELEETEAREHRAAGKLIDIPEFSSTDEAWPSYSRTEIDVRSGEKWLGLYASGGKVRLAETKVTRSPRRGYIGPGDELYDWLKYERKGELVFMAKDIAGLKPREVTTLFIKKSSDEGVYMEQAFRRVFKLGEIEYVLRVTTGLQRDGGKVNVLVLESQGRSQIVKFNYYYKDHNTLDNSIGELLWVGDMDGDGRLDMYFSDYGYEKGGFGSNLYLSSRASGEDLLEWVAGFSSAGC